MGSLGSEPTLLQTLFDSHVFAESTTWNWYTDQDYQVILEECLSHLADVIVRQQDVPRSQIPVHEPFVGQITHPQGDLLTILEQHLWY